MKKEFNKLFRVYIFDKNFTTRNAGGYPPSYMFWGENAIGERHDIYGESEKEVIDYVYSKLSVTDKENYTVMAHFLEDTPTKVIEE